MEGYATKWRGLFPTYVLAAFLLTAVASLLSTGVVDLLVSDEFTTSYISAYISVADVLYYPVISFLLFYLVSRSRVNLGSDYLGVALSILIGAMAGSVPGTLLQLDLSSLGNDPGVLATAINALASALDTGFMITAVGFTAVLLSYYRRM